MSLGLPVSRLINVSVNLAPLAAQFLNVDSLLIMGDSNVIDVSQRIRSYNTLGEVAGDFGTSAPEYLAAELFFSQLPQPTQLYVGRWAHAATSGILNGAALNATQQQLTNFTGISSGGIDFTIDGVARNLTGLNFTGASNLNGVASIIATALSSHGTCTWNGSSFQVVSSTTGTSSTVAFATAGAGTDISAITGLTQASGAATPIAGIAAETALQAVTILDNLATQFYGLMFASPDIIGSDHLAIAAYVQGSGNPHIYGVSSTDPNALVSTATTDIGYELQQGGYTRSFASWSSSNAYSAASIFGREFTVNFQGNNTVIDLMYKQEPGVVAETLTPTQASSLDTKRYNYFVNYNNNTAIIMNGWCSGPAFIDEIHGTDALANEIQTNLYNQLYQTATKIPQTDAGVHTLVTTCEATCAAFVSNGLLAPGSWTTGGFGTLNQGDFLSKGYYVYAQPIALQAPADRAARKAPPIQIAAKLAGAVNTVNVLVNVNR
jgi:hypothetical protein